MVMTAARANAAAEQRALAPMGLQGMGAAPAHQGSEWHRDDWGRVEWDRPECGGRGVGRCLARRGGLAGIGGVACLQ